MLKKKIFSVILAVALASSPFLLAVPASAAGTAVSYEDYSSVVVDGDNQLVTVSLPTEWANVMLYDTTNGIKLLKQSVGSHLIYEYLGETEIYNLTLACTPFGTDFSTPSTNASYNGRYLDLTNIPSGASYTLKFSIRFDNEANMVNPYGIVFDSASIKNGLLSTHTEQVDYDHQAEDPFGTCTITSKFPANAEGWSCKFHTLAHSAVNGSPMGGGTFYFWFDSFTITFTITALYQLQQQTGKTNAILTEVEKQLADNGQKLDDVIASQGQTNEKLDGIQDSLDNQMQNEIDKAEEMSSGASDQVAEAIPDKSAELLPAMQNLAASLSYQGTEAKLPFPKVAMPAIPGVCASFELIPAQDIDFGSYIQMMPTPFITIICALCDIAIVLWAFKELYGIYQYVISLKGGGVDV